MCFFLCKQIVREVESAFPIYVIEYKIWTSTLLVLMKYQTYYQKSIMEL